MEKGATVHHVLDIKVDSNVHQVRNPEPSEQTRVFVTVLANYRTIRQLCSPLLRQVCLNKARNFDIAAGIHWIRSIPGTWNCFYLPVCRWCLLCPRLRTKICRFSSIFANPTLSTTGPVVCHGFDVCIPRGFLHVEIARVRSHLVRLERESFSGRFFSDVHFALDCDSNIHLYFHYS